MAMSPGEQYAADNQMQSSGGMSAGDQMQQGQDVSENPILDAFRTIMTYVAALQEKGDPRAAAAQQHIAAFVDVINGQGGGQPMPQPSQQPQQGQQPMQSSQAPGGGRGVNPMVGMSGGVPAGRGQVAVI